MVMVTLQVGTRPSSRPGCLETAGVTAEMEPEVRVRIVLEMDPEVSVRAVLVTEV